jgi:hypothetical protein
MTLEMPAFEEFELFISPATHPGNYPVTTIGVQAGDAEGTLTLDPKSPEVQSALDAIAACSISRDGLRQFGTRLFDALLASRIRSMYRTTLGRAQIANKQLRFRLRISPPEISALPWEFLYDPESKLSLAISSNHCLSRYVPAGEQVRTLQVQPPLRILIVVSDPSNLDDYGLKSLQADAEVQRIKEALQKRGDEVKTEVLLHAVGLDLHDKLNDFRPHVVHFIGHGGFDGEQGMLMIEDEKHRVRLINDEDLAEFFVNVEDVRLVILNACQGATQSSTKALAGLAPQLVQRGLGAVVAMQYPIPDRISLAFAREFYRALAQYSSVDAAVSEGRHAIKAVFGSDKPDWGTPVIFMRSPDGVLFSPPQAVSVSKPSASPGGVSIQSTGPVNIGGGVAGGNISQGSIVETRQEPIPQEVPLELQIRLREILTERFSAGELDTLCFDLGVPAEDLPREKSGKARELVAYMKRYSRLPELVNHIRRNRPDIQW